MVGFLRGPLSLVERALAVVAAALLVAAVPLTDQAGFVLAAALVGVERLAQPSRRGAGGDLIVAAAATCRSASPPAAS